MIAVLSLHDLGYTMYSTMCYTHVFKFNPQVIHHFTDEINATWVMYAVLCGGGIQHMYKQNLLSNSGTYLVKRGFLSMLTSTFTH